MTATAVAPSPPSPCCRPTSQRCPGPPPTRFPPADSIPESSAWSVAPPPPKRSRWPTTRTSPASLLTDPIAGPEALGYGPHSGHPGTPRVDRRPRRRQRRPGSGHQRWAARCFAGLRRAAGTGRSIARGRSGLPRHHRIAELHSARVLPIPVGAHGLDVDALAWRLRSGQRIKVLYTVPDFHNPSGGVLPAAAPRSAGGTRRAVRIRHRLRQPLPGIRFRRRAGARTSAPIPIRWCASGHSPRPSDPGFGSAGSSPRPGWCRTWRTCGVDRTSIPRSSAND